MFENSFDFKLGCYEYNAKSTKLEVIYAMKKGEGMRKTLKVRALKMLIMEKMAIMISPTLNDITLTQLRCSRSS